MSRVRRAVRGGSAAYFSLTVPPGGASGAPTPTLCERMRLSCSVSSASALMRCVASLPKPVLMP